MSPRRLIVLFVVILLAFVGMAYRLVILQVVDSTRYIERAADQRQRSIPFPARRGAIFDREGEPLAISVDMQTIYADPALVDDPEGEALKLARVVDRPVRELHRALMGSSPKDRYEVIARHVEPKLARKVKALRLAGVYMKEEPRRFYPNGRLASHIIGFVDIDGNGRAGLEGEYESILKGTAGYKILEQDPAGNALPQADYRYERPEPGRSLFLTIDKDLQYFTELTLARAARRYSADAGTAIVLRPRTGEILAMANVPTFDPNRPGDTPAETWRNRAVTDMYEPGSAYKIVTTSAALEEKVVSPRSSFVVPDSMPYSDRIFHDSHPHATERMTVKRIITESSNVGTIKIGLELGGRKLDRYVRRFGFGKATGLDFPAEASGIVLDRKDWSGSTIATIPIGQGIAVTPLQMSLAYATIANGGVRVEPKLLWGTMDASGKTRASEPPARRRIVSRRTARQVTRILKNVVVNGTGVEARIPGYAVAGKTGTAQKPLPTGGYGNSYVGSFVGFAPAHRPEIVVFVALDEPSPIWGGSTAGPTFRTIAEFALTHLGVSPTGNAEKAARDIEASRKDQDPAHD